MSADDLDALSARLRATARVDVSGEVSWRAQDVPAVLSELASIGRVVLGLDVRDYSSDGTFREVAWSVYNGADATEARDAALKALELDDLPGEWVLVTW